MRKNKERQRIEKQIKMVHADRGGPFMKGLRDFTVLIDLVLDYIDKRVK